MSDFASHCPLHFSKRDDNGDCSWCRIAQGLSPRRDTAWVLTADDIEFLRGAGIDPELHTPTDLTTDVGGD
jgi:hypothetical protein